MIRNAMMNDWLDRFFDVDYDHPAETYDYEDSAGHIIYSVCRLLDRAGKPIINPETRKPLKMIRKPDGTYCRNSNDIVMVPYNLPRLINADPALFINIVDNEKRADKMQKIGLITTTLPMAIGTPIWDDAYGKIFQGRKVAILPSGKYIKIDEAKIMALSLLKFTNTVTIVAS